MRSGMAGRLALIIWGIYQMATTPLMAAEQPHHGKFPQWGMTKLNVTDLARSMAFYREIFGLKEAGRAVHDDTTEVILTRTGRPLEESLVLVYQKNRREPYVLGTAFNDIVFVVPDIDAKAKRIAAAGYEISPVRLLRPSPVAFASSLKFALTKDPDGFTVELIEFH